MRRMLGKVAVAAVIAGSLSVVMAPAPAEAAPDPRARHGDLRRPRRDR